MPTKKEVVIIIVMVIIAIIIINVENNKVKKYKEADIITEIKKTHIRGSEAFGSLRGAVFYEKNKFVATDATLIGNNPINKKFWKGHGPEVDFNNIPHQYSLYDLDFPYILWKLPNNDTINIIKGNLHFKFKMEQ